MTEQSYHDRQPPSENLRHSLRWARECLDARPGQWRTLTTPHCPRKQGLELMEALDVLGYEVDDAYSYQDGGDRHFTFRARATAGGAS